MTRIPTETPARIAPLPSLPLFHKLAGRKVVVAGAGQGVVWKAELLSAAGAEVLVLAGDEQRALMFSALAREPVDGPVTVLPRVWTPGDLAGAALAIADISDNAEAAAFIAAAHDAGAPVNIIDRTALCDVQFGTIVNRAPVVLAINTDGGAPMLGQSIRARLEAVLPRGLGAWAAAAKAWRPRLKGRITSFGDRRAFWERFVGRAWRDIDRAPDESDFEALLGGADPVRAQGKVILVGAGPGDPELLTMKAVRMLQSASVILYDDLVSPEVLELARREATRIAVGKKGHGPSVRQDEINRRIVALAQAGETVVRLKGGDPLIFGRATEEIDACRAAGVRVEIVPGISAAQGAAAALGFSLTERETARRVQYVTGHDASGVLPTDLNWKALADPEATTIVYMPRRTLAGLAENVIAAGLDPHMPALAIANATRVDQAVLRDGLAGLVSRLDELPKGAPLLVIIGQVARDPAAALALLKAA